MSRLASYIAPEGYPGYSGRKTLKDYLRNPLFSGSLLAAGGYGAYKVSKMGTLGKLLALGGAAYGGSKLFDYYKSQQQRPQVPPRLPLPLPMQKTAGILDNVSDEKIKSVAGLTGSGLGALWGTQTAVADTNMIGKLIPSLGLPEFTSIKQLVTQLPKLPVKQGITAGGIAALSGLLSYHTGKAVMNMISNAVVKRRNKEASEAIQKIQKLASQDDGLNWAGILGGGGAALGAHQGALMGANKAARDLLLPGVITGVSKNNSSLSTLLRQLINTDSWTRKFIGKGSGKGALVGGIAGGLAGLLAKNLIFSSKKKGVPLQDGSGMGMRANFGRGLDEETLLQLLNNNAST